MHLEATASSRGFSKMFVSGRETLRTFSIICRLSSRVKSIKRKVQSIKGVPSWSLLNDERAQGASLCSHLIKRQSIHQTLQVWNCLEGTLVWFGLEELRQPLVDWSKLVSL